MDESSNDPIEDPELVAAVRRLRDEALEEAAELEIETDLWERRHLDLGGVALRAMMEGDQWQVMVGERSFDGGVVHVGKDFVGLTDEHENLYDIAHRAIDVINVVGREPSNGRAPYSFRPTLLAGRIADIASRGRACEVGDEEGRLSLAGRIEAIGRDHVVFRLANGGASILPHTAIGYIVRRPEQTRRSR